MPSSSIRATSASTSTAEAEEATIMSNQTTRTAIHEAGHVVAHVVLDLAIDTDTVTIVADDDSLGHATSPNPTFGYASTDKRDRERCRRDAAQRF